MPFADQIIKTLRGAHLVSGPDPLAAIRNAELLAQVKMAQEGIPAATRTQALPEVMLRGLSGAKANVRPDLASRAEVLSTEASNGLAWPLANNLTTEYGREFARQRWPMPGAGGPVDFDTHNRPLPPEQMRLLKALWHMRGAPSRMNEEAGQLRAARYFDPEMKALDDLMSEVRAQALEIGGGSFPPSRVTNPVLKRLFGR